MNILTPKEYEICKTIIRQKVFKKQDIANCMNMSLGTIQRHITNIFEKLDVHTMAELVDWLHTNKD